MVGIPVPGTSAASATQTTSRQSAQVNSALPDSIKRAAIATRSSSGRIAGTRIGNTNHFIAYIDARSGCGSGGCRAQIWTLNGARPVRKESIAVGRLPIVLLPDVDNGMPRIGITTTTNNNRLAILPIAYDGHSYTREMYDNLLPPNTGRPLLTRSMLRPY
jgi:hypothetical protein